MAVKIRLTRMGSKKSPYYRVVVTDSRKPRDGKFIEVVGRYDPMVKENKVSLDEAKIKEWLSKGAIPTDSARRLFHMTGLLAKWDEEAKAKYRELREARLREKAVPLEKLKQEMGREDEEEAPAEEQAVEEKEDKKDTKQAKKSTAKTTKRVRATKPKSKSAAKGKK